MGPDNRQPGDNRCRSCPTGDPGSCITLPVNLRQRLGIRIAALLGVSAYVAAAPEQPSLDDPEIERRRALFGGNIQPIAWSQTRWYQADVETAIRAADSGILTPLARLWRAAGADGRVRGVLGTRTAGLVALPKRFRGRAEIVRDLQATTGSSRSVFDEMNPPAELEKLLADGIGCGVGVAEYVPVPGRDYPVLVRLDPEFLVYRWHENRWYFRSNVGELPITPGDGRWVLHTPGGRMAPWQHALAWAVGKAWIRKEHAQLHKDNWESKLANPARVAVAPQGASEKQKQSWFQKVMAWGVNTVFGLTPGYDVKLLESNGRGYESFSDTVTEQNEEIGTALAGQTVTQDGGSGFINGALFRDIRGDIIRSDAAALAYTINTQGLPAFIITRYGEDALVDGATVEWDATSPQERMAEATAATTLGTAIKSVSDALQPFGLEPDVEAMCLRAGVPVRKITREFAAAPAANEKPAEGSSNVVPIRRAA